MLSRLTARSSRAVPRTLLPSPPTADLRDIELASACGVSERTLTRRLTAAPRLTPLCYQQLLWLPRAEHLIGRGAAVDAAALIVGFTDARISVSARQNRVLSAAARVAVTGGGRVACGDACRPAGLPPVR
jgi:AraC-like DNA-binding protein